MTTDQSIFNGTNSQETPAQQTGSAPAGTTTQNNSNPYADLLGSIRNETGAQKYNSVEDALKGTAHAQSFIQQLQQEKRELEQKLSQLSQKEDETTELKRTVQELIQRQDQASNQGQGLKTEDVADLINRQLTQREREVLAKQNQANVVAAATAAFGTDAEKKFIEAAQEAGLSVEEMNSLAAKSPKAVLKMLGVSGQPAQKQGTSAPGTGINTTGFAPAQESFVGRNKNQVTVGASTEELFEERVRSNKMVEELHANGLSVHDLTNPRTYNKYFGK